MRDILLHEGVNELNITLKSEVVPSTGEVWGIVYESMKAMFLSGVIVAVNGYETRTDGNGKYKIGGIIPGTYAMTFSLAGYRMVEPSLSVSIRADVSLYIRYVMIPA